MSTKMTSQKLSIFKPLPLQNPGCAFGLYDQCSNQLWRKAAHSIKNAQIHGNHGWLSVQGSYWGV